MKKSTFSKLTSVALAALVMGGCQGSDPLNRESNPVKDYKEIIDEAIPLQDQKQRTQAYAGDLYVIDVNENGKTKMIFNFAEGVQKTYQLNVRMLVEKVTFTAKLELPKEAEGKGITWNPSGSLSWTPPSRTIPTTQSSVSYKGKIVLIPVTTDPKAIKLLANKDLSTEIEIKVSRLEAEPKIKAISGINDKTVHPGAFNFSLTVSDPAMGEVRNPVIQFVDPVGKLTAEQKDPKKKEYVQVISTQSFITQSVVKSGTTSTVNYKFSPARFVEECELNNIDLSKMPEELTVVSNVVVISYGQTSLESSIAFQIKNPKAVKAPATQGAKK